MAIAFVQSRSVSLGVVTGGNLAFTSNNAAGNFIIVAVQVGAAGRTLTVTDTNLNTYTQHRNQPGGAREIFLVAAPNIAAGANTVSVAISGAAASMSFAIYEYSGIDTASPLDQTNSATATSAHADSGNITTTTNEQLIFSIATAAGAALFEMVGVAGTSANAAAASGDLSVTPPTTVTDDIMILAVTTQDNVAVTLPAGWNIYQEADNGADLRATLAWKRCVGAEGAFTITHTAGDTIVANVANFRGCQELATPINASVLTSNASSSTVTAATISSTKNGCRLFFSMHDSDNGASSAQTSANLGAMAELFDNASGLGTDAAVSGAHVNQNASGASGASTGTVSVGPDVNSGGNTFLEPFFLKREEVTNIISTAELLVSATGTFRGYYYIPSGVEWACIVASFKAQAAAVTVKQLALLGVG